MWPVRTNHIWAVSRSAASPGLPKHVRCPHPLLLYLAYILLKIITKLIITISRISAFMRAHTNLGRERWVQASRVFLPTFLSIACARSFDVLDCVHGPHFIGRHRCKGYNRGCPPRLYPLIKLMAVLARDVDQ
jgi:hypothetical protein